MALTSWIARVPRAGLNDYLEGATLAPRWRAARTRGPVGGLLWSTIRTKNSRGGAAAFREPRFLVDVL